MSLGFRDNGGLSSSAVDWVGKVAVLSDELNLSHSHHNILFYCVLAVKFSSEKINVHVCSSMSYDVCL